MSEANVALEKYRVAGKGECAKGDHPDPPLDGFPLLAWSRAHPKLGQMVVHLTDNTASVHDVAVAFAATPDMAAVAARFGTDEHHVAQAVQYATKCAFLVAE